jgi:purine-nucleoside phosphorylase
MPAIWEKLNEIKDFISEQWDFKPKVAIILGSGLSNFTKDIEIEVEIDYDTIPYFPRSLVEHQLGVLVLGKVSGQKAMIFNGRFHHYEGLSPKDVSIPVQLAKVMGATNLIVTNSAGALNDAFEPGQIMLITDQINFTGGNPLNDVNEFRLGPRFPSLDEVFSKELRDLTKRTATKCNVRLEQGIYVAVNGPSTETPAEYKMLQILGGDAVGMSTVYETIAAAHCGLKTIGLSVITDAVSQNGGKVTPKDAQKAAKIAEKDIYKLIKKVMEKLCAKSISNQ